MSWFYLCLYAARCVFFTLRWHTYITMVIERRLSWRLKRAVSKAHITCDIVGDISVCVEWPTDYHVHSLNYRPQRSCKGYVFTGVCLSTRGLSASVHAGIPHREQTPPTRADTPPEQTHTPPEQTTPGSRHPPKQTPPPQRRPLLRTVRILLECILV